MKLFCFVVRQIGKETELLTRTSFTDRRYDVPSGMLIEGEDHERAVCRIVKLQTGIHVKSNQITDIQSQNGDALCTVRVSEDARERFSYTMPDVQRDIAEFHYRWLPVDATLSTMLVGSTATYVNVLPFSQSDVTTDTVVDVKPGLKQRISAILVHIWGNWPIPEWVRDMVVRLVEPKYLAGVVGIIFDDDNRVLLVRHTYRKQYPWAPPSGWIKRGEDPTQALEREVYEETGYRIWVGGAIAVGGDKDIRRLDLYYRCALLGGVFRPCAEVSEAGLYTLEALPEEMEPFHREVISYASKRPGAAIPPRAV